MKHPMTLVMTALLGWATGVVPDAVQAQSGVSSQPLSSARAASGLPVMKGWTPVFVDDFGGKANTLPSPALWKFDTGHNYPGGPPNWGTNETQRYTASLSNIHEDGQGHLLVIPRREPDGSWTSARIETRKDTFQAPVGGVLRIESRIRMPDVTGEKAIGYWPAFWALGRSFRQTGRWPASGEFDIMESVNGLDGVWGILHCGVYPGGPCGEPSGIGSHLPCPQTVCYGQFHTYTFEWDRRANPEEFRWTVDGQLFNRITQSQMPGSTWDDITRQGGFFLLLNVAMGGGFSWVMNGGGETPAKTTEDGHAMMVDYVGVWVKPAPLLPHRKK